jgi:hypothetical protein
MKPRVGAAAETLPPDDNAEDRICCVGFGGRTAVMIAASRFSTPTSTQTPSAPPPTASQKSLPR